MLSVFRKVKSRFVGYAIMALGISLVCNFSYLLLLVSNQNDGNTRINNKRNSNAVSVVVEGKLSVHCDGYGYLITESGDSIYIDHRRVNWLGLTDKIGRAHV